MNRDTYEQIAADLEALRAKYPELVRVFAVYRSDIEWEAESSDPPITDPDRISRAAAYVSHNEGLSERVWEEITDDIRWALEQA